MSMQIVSTTDNADAVTAAMGNLAETKPIEDKKEVSKEVEAKASDATKESKTQESVEAKAETESEELLEESEVEESDETDDELEKPKKKSSGFKKKFERTEKLRVSLEQEKEFWRNEALKVKPQTSEEKTQAKPDLSKKPKAETFNSHDEYVEALTDWKLDQRDLKQKEEKVKTEAQSKIGKHQERVKEFAKAHDDWDDVIETVGNTPLSITVQEAILSSDLGPELMYELAKDPKEFKRICALSPIQAAMALGKIEARVTKSDSSKEEKLTTKAPPPIKPVRSKGTTVETGYRDDMSLTDYDKWRKADRAKRAGA